MGDSDGPVFVKSRNMNRKENRDVEYLITLLHLRISHIVCVNVTGIFGRGTIFGLKRMRT